MTDASLRELAQEVGIEVEWQNHVGEPHAVSPDALRLVLERLGYPCGNDGEINESRERVARSDGIEALPPLLTALVNRPVRLALPSDPPRRARLMLESGLARDLALRETHNGVELPAIAEPGYHRLSIGNREIVLAVTPERATIIADLASQARIWGLAAQVYGLRRPGDGGIGDAAGIAELAEAAARAGADALALSPMHALFPAQPHCYGPYSPSSRLFLNPLHAAPEMVLGVERVAHAIRRTGLAQDYARLEARTLIDWPAAAGAKLRLLRDLFAHFRSGTDVPDALRADFTQFETDGGELLAGHVCFEALQAEQLAADGTRGDWHDWPSDLRDPSSATVAAFAQAHRRDILFHLFLQWLTDRSLAAAQRRARAAGMRIGLIADLAVGMHPAGSHAWSRQQDILSGLMVGAPPDLFNPNGQQWGITTFSPRALADTGYAPFIATVRAALRHSGGVRIDHAMGLQRLWLVPEGESPADGAYLNYPLTDMLRLLALESQRHRAIVVGEDLGTVPAGFRDRLDAHGIYGMRVLWFERTGDGFLPPEQWDRDTLAMTSTHDLPTVASWWLGADIELRATHGLLGRKLRRDALVSERADDRHALWSAFRDAGVADGEVPGADATPAVDAATRFVARTASSLALLPLEDVLGSPEQPNLPGTLDEHPNWRRRAARPAGELLDQPGAAQRIGKLAAERPR